jgi:CBS domain-containing protein
MQATPQNVPAFVGVIVGQAMRHGLVSCLPDDDLATVASELVTYGVHAAAVAPIERGAPLILTDIDLVRAALTRAGRVRAVELTHEPAALLSSEAPLSEAVAMMSERYTRHLLVADPVTGAAIGFLSSLDVAAVLGDLPRGAAVEIQGAVSSRAQSAGPLGETAVDSVARRGIVTCAADVSLRTVARTMAEQCVHCVAVAGIEHPSEHLVWGLIEDIDLMVAAHGGALSQPAVGFAESSPIAVESSDSLARAAELMVEHGTSHLVVVGPTGLPASIVSTLDVAAVLAAG